ncbi:hypothetical protein L523_1456 [Bordetella bronchiseptica MBORD731]|nr:hypothetical protein L523_1456 [Bordetella bronchiseptica MBORD731]
MWASNFTPCRSSHRLNSLYFITSPLLFRWNYYTTNMLFK